MLSPRVSGAKAGSESVREDRPGKKGASLRAGISGRHPATWSRHSRGYHLVGMLSPFLFLKPQPIYPWYQQTETDLKTGFHELASRAGIPVVDWVVEGLLKPAK